jgi:phosphoenolpyruvate carboxylase
MIQAKFGLPEIAERSLEVYITSTLEATLLPGDQPRPEWRDEMQRLADVSRASYRNIVFETPEFLEYFRTATPELELGALNIGSRPARRKTSGGVESLRAIPWQFAWTQTRLLLPTWLGLESAFADARGRDAVGMLKEMYASWPFFRSTIDLMEMALAKSDLRISAHYDRELVTPPLRTLGGSLRRRLLAARDCVLEITGHRVLVENNAVLRRSIDVRNPYVDPINIVQVELLRRMRGSDEASEQLSDAFTITVNGIAAGLRNTG